MKRILAIDGGGIKGVFPASFLATVEEVIGDRVVRYFDLIAGTSTGGIIALGLGLGLSAREILDLYVDNGPRIFPSAGGLWRRFPSWVRRWFRAAYDPAPLRAALDARVGGRRLGESSTRLVIPSFNLETGQPNIYKTSHADKLVLDYRCDAVEVAMATTAAPTFFPTFRSAVGLPLIDGGVLANNPVGIAVVVAISLLQWRPDEAQVLSLGCTTAPLDTRTLVQARAGKLQWAIKVADVFLQAQSELALGTASVIVGHERVKRISPIVASGRFDLDANQEIDTLRGLGMAEARSQFPRLQPVFFSDPAEPFEPAHRLP